jgi:hypothetical protein
MKILRLFIILLILYAVSCQKDELLPSKGFEEVTLRNLSGLDGCGFVFLMKDKKYLEPVNLEDFLISYKDGEKYLIKYEIAHHQASICMVGEIINIVELRKQNK